MPESGVFARGGGLLAGGEVVLLLRSRRVFAGGATPHAGDVATGSGGLSEGGYVEYSPLSNIITRRR